MQMIARNDSHGVDLCMYGVTQAPPLLDVNGCTEEKLFRSKSADMEQTTEKEQMRKMLSEG